MTVLQFARWEKKAPVAGFDVCTANNYIQKSDQAVDEGQIDEAMGYVNMALAIEPLRARLWLRLGTLQQEREEFKDAIISYRRALELGDNLAIVHAGIGLCAEELGNYDEAEQACMRRIELEPTASGYIMLGSVQRSQGRDADAEQSFRQALKLDPSNDEAMVNLAIELRQRKQTEEAIPLLREAIKIDPNYALAYEELGINLRIQGEGDEAELMLRKAIELDDHRIWAYLYLGELLEAVDEPSAAEEQYLRALEIDPTFNSCHIMLGNFYTSEDQKTDAERHYRRAVEIECDGQSAFKLGEFLVRHGRREEGIQWLEKALRIEPGHARARRMLSELE